MAERVVGEAGEKDSGGKLRRGVREKRGCESDPGKGENQGPERVAPIGRKEDNENDLKREVTSDADEADRRKFFGGSVHRFNCGSGRRVRRRGVSIGRRCC